jgi:hypothetical protein
MTTYDPALPLYLQHVPKTAGTSMATMLVSAFPADEICPVAHWDKIVLLPKVDLVNYRLFIGHYASYLERFLKKRLNKIALLREPVDRTISHFAFIQRDATHPFYHKVQSQTLRDFVEDPETRPNVENYQARYLADFGYDPSVIAATDFGSANHDFPLQMHIDELSMREDPTDLRAKALTALDDFVLIGVVEDFSVHIKRLADILGVEFGAPVWANVSPQRPANHDLDKLTLGAIHDATPIDRELYEIVRGRAGNASDSNS